MRVTYYLTIQARSLPEAIEKVGLNNMIGQPIVIANTGAGTELHNLISLLGLKPSVNCKCAQHIRDMDLNGVEWCDQNISVITEWLREEARQANLPFINTGAKVLIKRAISNARQKQKGKQDMTVKLIVEIDTDDVYEALTRTKPKEGKVIAANVEPPRPQVPAQQQNKKP